MLSPQGRVIMVSGANRGIGQAIARALHGKGYSLSLGARSLEALEEATADFDRARVARHRYEARDRAAAAAWVEATAARFGRIDGLVNAAGILLSAGIEDDAEQRYDELWAVNVMGPLALTRLALPHLRAVGSGRIVNLASLSGKRVAGDNAAYPLSKFAVVALSHATRRAGWEDGVRVTALCPGYVATDMVSDVADPPAEAMIQPADLAELAATVIALPNTASVAELLVSCRFEDSL
ncbi:MAG: SDR family NAD(P)-dependent oxidoreductase [Kiloniellales bacterium]|nr:SDR family NAD(P)-dependent oxidoreductase [Kiloniellales bacterium]